MASFSVKAGLIYGFKSDVGVNLESDLKQGGGIHVGFCYQESDFHGSDGTTNHPEGYSPGIDLPSNLHGTLPEHALESPSPSLVLSPCSEPPENEQSSSEVDVLKEGEASSDEELLSLKFQSKLFNTFPLYQDYTLQAIRGGVQLKDAVLLAFQGLHLFLKGRDLWEAGSPSLTPKSTSPPSPGLFPGRRSAVRRHSHSGLVSSHPPPDSFHTQPCFHEGGSSLNTKKKLQFETISIGSDDVSPTRPSSVKLTSGTLWQELEEVKDSGLVKILTSKEIGLQESMFELIGSEVSYLKSLGVLISHFYASKELKKTMSKVQHHTLFYNIRDVMEANTKFLLDLDARLAESLVILQVGDIVLQHCGNFQQHYIPYVTNMMYQEPLVNQLLQKNKEFLYALKKLERDPVCEKQNLKSFLVLPFQRITRMKLQLESILKLTEPNSEAVSNIKKAMQSIHEILLECQQKVEKFKRFEELLSLEALLDFGDIRSVPLMKSSRFLIHHGHLSTVESYGTRISTIRIYLHLFNDLLIISSKKCQRFTVLDYALFPDHVMVLEDKVQGLPLDSFVLHLSQSQTGPPTVVILIANESFEKEVWLKALSKK